MLLNAEQVNTVVNTAIEALGAQFSERLNELVNVIEQLKPPSVEPYLPVVIQPGVGNGNSTLDLIKSVPEFKGSIKEYPAWREAAYFAMNYYVEGSENFYIATGILRNKIMGSANVTLSSFNTVLNFKAIIDRLDQCYSDKRPIYVLESELSVLRQGNLSIKDFYDNVDKQLTLIVNRNKMGNTNNEQVISALNERARENALRVFVSGLKRPICDILFSSNPKDLPSALAVAEELEYSQHRQEFARVFYNNTAFRPRPIIYSQIAGKQVVSSQKPNLVQDNPMAMEIDPGSSLFRKNRVNPSNRFRQQELQQQKPESNEQQQRLQVPSNALGNQSYQQIRRTPFFDKNLQNVHYMPHAYAESVTYDEDGHENADDYSDGACSLEINFLE